MLAKALVWHRHTQSEVLEPKALPKQVAVLSSFQVCISFQICYLSASGIQTFWLGKVASQSCNPAPSTSPFSCTKMLKSFQQWTYISADQQSRNLQDIAQSIEFVDNEALHPTDVSKFFRGGVRVEQWNRWWKIQRWNCFTMFCLAYKMVDFFL